MLRRKTILPIIVAAVVALGAALEKQGIDTDALLRGDFGALFGNGTSEVKQNSNQSSNSFSTAGYKSGSKWSNTSPEINLHHVFEGEINKKGRATGYHSRPGGVDPDGVKVVSIRDKPNRAGVYTAVIAVRDGNQWKEKNSSFFPDNLSADEVTAAIVNAYKSGSKKGMKWSGPSGYGYTIEGWTTSRGGINTAYPIYRGNQ